MEFQLNGQEYIELMKLLKYLGLVDTGTDAKLQIDAGEVMVNGKQELRRRNKLRAGYKVEFNGQTVFIKE
ncbi:MAG: RNA-binding protein [Bacteroidetes bacterium 4484_276]|nr:MAG: RNA-binding protein [Bacteroidetes bacterium 4484_276]